MYLIVPSQKISLYLHTQLQTALGSIIKCHLTYSAFDLERPFFGFVVNNNCFCSQKLTILAIWLKFGLKVHTSLLDRFGKFKVFLLPGNKVISAYEPGGELRIVKKCVRARKRILS